MTYTLRGEGIRLRWTHVDGGRGFAPCGCPHRKIKLESTDIIFSSSHAKKLVYFYQNFVFGWNKKWKFVLAVSREWCVFHVDRTWTSTRGGGSGPCGRMSTGEGGRKPNFFVDVINGWSLPMLIQSNK